MGIGVGMAFGIDISIGIDLWIVLDFLALDLLLLVEEERSSGWVARTAETEKKTIHPLKAGSCRLLICGGPWLSCEVTECFTRGRLGHKAEHHGCVTQGDLACFSCHPRADSRRTPPTVTSIEQRVEPTSRHFANKKKQSADNKVTS